MHPSICDWWQNTEHRSSMTNLIPFHSIPNEIKYLYSFALLVRCFALHSVPFINAICVAFWFSFPFSHSEKSLIQIWRMQVNQIIILWWIPFCKAHRLLHGIRFDLIFDTQTSDKFFAYWAPNIQTFNITEFEYNQINKHSFKVYGLGSIESDKMIWTMR